MMEIFLKDLRKEVGEWVGEHSRSSYSELSISTRIVSSLMDLVGFWFYLKESALRLRSFLRLFISFIEIL